MTNATEIKKLNNKIEELQKDKEALMAQVRQLKNADRATPIESLMEYLTLPQEVLRNGDFVVSDVMLFQRKIIMEALMDKIDWLMNSPKGTESYLTKQKVRIANAKRRFSGDEISAMFLRGAIAEAKSASIQNETLGQLYGELQSIYAKEHGSDYTPYGRVRNSNVRSDTPAEIPADIAAELKALGMSPTVGTIANTDGVDDTRDIA
jgi:hypothetical protein